MSGMIAAMSPDDDLSPEVRQQLLATLEEMAEVLRSIEGLADQRGYFDAWWTLVQRMIVVRGQALLAPVGPDFADAMQELCLEYDVFVETVLPNPPEH